MTNEKCFPFANGTITNPDCQQCEEYADCQTSRKYKRTWCKSCNSFVVHERINKDYTCIECGTIFSSYNPFELLRDGHENEVIQQKMRYKQSRNNLHMNTEEDDAGHIAITKAREKINRKSEELISKAKEIREIKYKNIGRNDTCPCKSGKKFKYCCGEAYSDSDLTLEGYWIHMAVLYLAEGIGM